MAKKGIYGRYIANKYKIYETPESEKDNKFYKYWFGEKQALFVEALTEACKEDGKPLDSEMSFELLIAFREVLEANTHPDLFTPQEPSKGKEPFFIQQYQKDAVIFMRLAKEGAYSDLGVDEKALRKAKKIVRDNYAVNDKTPSNWLSHWDGIEITFGKLTPSNIKFVMEVSGRRYQNERPKRRSESP